jgi:hypothetical protein
MGDADPGVRQSKGAGESCQHAAHHDGMSEGRSDKDALLKLLILCFESELNGAYFSGRVEFMLSNAAMQLLAVLEVKKNSTFSKGFYPSAFCSGEATVELTKEVFLMQRCSKRIKLLAVGRIHRVWL